jgi:dihydrofolate reductase
MSNITLYIASSLDGYIADKNGSVVWLEEIPNPDNTDYGYAEFLEEIDTVVMGRTTYEQVLRFGGDWPYIHQHTVIVSSDKSYQPRTQNTTVLSTLHRSVIEKLRSQSHKGIWLVGGGQLVSAFLKLHAIDRMMLFVMPRMLGSGIRLFPEESPSISFKLDKVSNYNSGVVLLDYKKT